jgi:2-polyprenyl-6-hydroxyphenyl methylase/3-demethylubiquinone-9 3-methyltransferase
MKARSTRFPILTTLAAMLPGVSNKDTWEREYAEGRWSALGAGGDSDRYAIILGHLIRRGTPSSLLDVGCGSGHLLEFVSHAKLTHYTGIDISEEAIKIAQQRGFADTSFAASTAEDYTPTRKFDVVVFNEVVFYLKDPRAVLTRYQSYLEPGGLLLVSMVDCPLAHYHWHKLSRGFSTKQRTQVGAGGALSWSIRALEPKPARG